MSSFLFAICPVFPQRKEIVCTKDFEWAWADPERGPQSGPYFNKQLQSV